MSFNYFFNGAFNINSWSNLILTVRLTGKLPRTKRLGQGKISFIVFIFKREKEEKWGFWREFRTKREKTFPSIEIEEQIKIYEGGTKIEKTAQKSRRGTEIEKGQIFLEFVQQYVWHKFWGQSDIFVQQYGCIKFLHVFQGTTIKIRIVWFWHVSQGEST